MIMRYFPKATYLFRTERVSKTTRIGGVFVFVSDAVVCSEQPQLNLDCEIIWVRLETLQLIISLKKMTRTV